MRNRRMEKYYKSSSKVSSRCLKNEELYRTIYDTSEYTNIEGIASIEKTNQIDLTQIQEFLKKMENKEEPKIDDNVNKPKEIHKTQTSVMDDEVKNYDIRDVLNKAKTERPQQNMEHYQLNNTHYNIFKKIKMEELASEQELKELIHTITNTSMLNKLEDRELSLNLLSSLQAGEETMIREKQELEEQEKTDINIDQIDKSFFTSGLNFCDEDFEDLKDLNKNLKKSNFLIKALTFLIIFIIIAAVIYFIYTIYKP